MDWHVVLAINLDLAAGLRKREIILRIDAGRRWLKRRRRRRFGALRDAGVVLCAVYSFLEANGCFCDANGS